MSRIPDIFALNVRNWVGILRPLNSGSYGAALAIRLAKLHRERGAGAAEGSHRNALRQWILLPALVLLNACGPSKSELDAEVRRLCAIDGGYFVHSKIVLPSEKFDQLDVGSIRARAHARATDEYFYETSIEFILKGNPELSKSKTRFFRKSDGLNFATLTVYSRVGGDLWGPWQESSFACPNPTTLPKLSGLAFIRGK